jgi:predicted DCC family thiol-disulfide oxidoreductase YuxK
MRKTPDFPLQVFYDGSCQVCSTEMSVYMRKDHGGRLEFVDISAPGFNPQNYGISLDDFMFQMHAIDRSGRVYRGVDAFQAIWRAFPGDHWFRFLGALAEFPLVRPIARLAYRIFARLRKYLPKKKAACSIGRRPPR